MLSHVGFPDGSAGKEPAYQCRRIKRHEFISWVRKVPWRRKWQPIPVFLPGKSMDTGEWWATVHGVTKSWTWLSVRMHARTHTHTHTHTLFHNIHFLVPILSSGSSWYNFHHETILTHLTKVTIKDFKGKYRTGHLESKLKICYQRQHKIWIWFSAL